MAYAIRLIDYNLFSGSFRTGKTPSVTSNRLPGIGYDSSGSLSGWWRLKANVSATGDVVDWAAGTYPGTFASDPTHRPAYSTALYPSQSLHVQAASCTFNSAAPSAVRIGTAAAWNAVIGTVGTSQMTFSLWAYKTGDGGFSVGRLFQFGNTGAQGIALYTTSTGILKFETGWNGFSTGWQTGTSAIALNTWIHIAVTYDATAVPGTRPKVYLNSHSVESLSAFGTLPSAPWDGISGAVSVLGNNTTSTVGWDGQISDVGVWNSILTAEEIKAIYEVSSTGTFVATRNYDLIGSKATPPYTGSYGSTLQGLNITTFKRFGMSVAPKMGRSDRPAVFLSASSGMIDVTPEKNDFFDASLRLPQRATFESKLRTLTVTGSDGVVRNSIVTGSNQQMIGEDSVRVVEIPQYVLNHQAYGLENLFVEKDPFVEMDQFKPVTYIEDPLRMAWPVVMENPSPLDPFDFNGAIEPFALRRPLAGFSTFVGNAEDPEPTGMRGSVSSGMMQDVFYKRSVAATNFYFPANTGIEPFEMIGASEEYDELPPRSISATGSLYFTGQPVSGETLVLTSSAGVGGVGAPLARTYTAGAVENTATGEFLIAGTLANTRQSILNCILVFHSGTLMGTNVPETLSIQQTAPGYAGNTTITSSLTNVTVRDFSGGSGIWKPVHAYVKQLPYMTAKTSSIKPFVDETSPEDAFYYVSNREIRNLLETTFTKANRLGVPSRAAKSADCGWSYENSTFGIDSVAFGGLKK